MAPLASFFSVCEGKWIAGVFALKWTFRRYMHCRIERMKK